MKNPFTSRVDEPRKYLSPITRTLRLMPILVLSILMFAGSMQAASLTDYGVLAYSTVTNTGPTIVSGDLGLYPGTSVTGFPPGFVTGTMDIANANANTALGEALIAYNAAAAGYAACLLNTPSPAGPNLTGYDLGGLTLTPGTYCFSSSAGLTGTLTLNFEGVSSNVFIFQIGSTLTTASGSSVLATNTGGPPVCNNITWQVGSSATLGTGTTFLGDIIANTSITVDGTAGASNDGSLWALGGAVTFAGATTVTACESSAPPAPLLPYIQVLKFCDLNGDGLLDPLDPSIKNWQIGFIPDPNKCSGFTDANGLLMCAGLPLGTYDVFEGIRTNWVHTATCIDGVCGACSDNAAPCQNDSGCSIGATCVPNLPPANPVAIDLPTSSSHHQVEFGNIYLGTGGGRTMAFWASTSGRALINGSDLTLLNTLNLVNMNGTAFNPSTSAQVATWLLNATTGNMAYMLSAQLAAMELNVQHGFVSGTALVFARTAPGTCTVPGLSVTGFITINDLMADANDELAAFNMTLIGNPERVCQAFKQNALNVANNNQNFAFCLGQSPTPRPTCTPTPRPTCTITPRPTCTITPRPTCSRTPTATPTQSFF